MGKVYFYALDLARISASQTLLVGKVPITKLDLARSGPTKWNSGSLPEKATRSGDTEGTGTAGGLPRHRRRSVAGAAAIIRPAAGSNIPEGLSSPACYCPLPEAWSVIGIGLKICLILHAPTRPPLRDESAAVAVV